MTLILANNQSERFTKFFTDLNKLSSEPLVYSGYRSLLFSFGLKPSIPIDVINLATNQPLDAFKQVYINGYLNTYELAAATAIACQTLNIKFINQEMASAPSMSKLSMYAKLAAAGIPVPPTIAGTKYALLQGEEQAKSLGFPLVLKRADADRGIDNYLVANYSEVKTLLESHPERSLWLLQSYIQNQGFYLISFYDSEPAFCIYRKLEARPDKIAQKAHMYKPKGGSNASLIELKDIPKNLLAVAAKAVKAMNRQIASVDCLYDTVNDQVRILEVNYNPQLVTIETYKSERIEAFLKFFN